MLNIISQKKAQGSNKYSKINTTIYWWMLNAKTKVWSSTTSRGVKLHHDQQMALPREYFCTFMLTPCSPHQSWNISSASVALGFRSQCDYFICDKIKNTEKRAGPDGSYDRDIIQIVDHIIIVLKDLHEKIELEAYSRIWRQIWQQNQTQNLIFDIFGPDIFLNFHSKRKWYEKRKMVTPTSVTGLSAFHKRSTLQCVSVAQCYQILNTAVFQCR